MNLRLVIPALLVLVGGCVSWIKSPAVKKESLTAFECGFSRLRGSRRRFSLYFFHVAILFLVFDAEVLVLLPLVEASNLSVWGGVSVIIFVLILTGGLYYEWREGAIERPGW